VPYAWCLLSDVYHLLLRTLDAPVVGDSGSFRTTSRGATPGARQLVWRDAGWKPALQLWSPSM